MPTAARFRVSPKVPPSAEDVLPEADRLRGAENWPAWVARLMPILQRHDLELIVSTKEPCATLMEIISEEAMDIIRWNCSPHVLSGARCSNPWILWKRLEYRYSRRPPDIALDTLDSKTVLRNDVAEFNAAFNLRVRQIFGYHCREPYGSQSSKVRNLYYDTVGEVYDYWVRLTKSKEQEGCFSSMDDIQASLVSFTQHMKRFGAAEQDGRSDDQSSSGILTPSTGDEEDTAWSRTQSRRRSGEDCLTDESAEREHPEGKQPDKHRCRNHAFEQESLQNSQPASENTLNQTRSVNDESPKLSASDHKKKRTKSRHSKEERPVHGEYSLTHFFLTLVALLMAISWLFTLPNPRPVSGTQSTTFYFGGDFPKISCHTMSCSSGQIPSVPVTVQLPICTKRDCQTTIVCGSARLRENVQTSQVRNQTPQEGHKHDPFDRNQ